MKYMGSKSRIAKAIVPIIQQYIDDNKITNYIEPFCGGCNVIDKIKCDTRIASDINPYLIALLKRVQNKELLYDEVSKELYDKVRDSFNNKDNAYADWEYGNIGFLASYNGRFFDGGYAKPGYEKLRNGGQRYRDYYRESKDNILSQNLDGINFVNNDYRKLNVNSSLIYCDPPYANTKQFANSLRFDHDEFWNYMRKWSENNIVLISELNAPEDFECIWEQSVSRSIKSTDKSRDIEKLFVNKNCLVHNKKQIQQIKLQREIAKSVKNDYVSVKPHQLLGGQEI